MDLVSVIIPYFKKKKYISETINSVLNQSYENLEILIIYDDDCFKDLDFLEEIKKKDKRISIIKNQKNLGAGTSRNIGISKSKGKYLAFLDADDFWKNNKLSYQISIMKKLNIKISHTSYYIINENNKIIEKRKAKLSQTYNDLLNSCDIGLSSVIIEKKLFLKNKFSSNKTKEDYAAWLKISKKIPIFGIKKYLLFWRKTKNSLSSNIYQKIIDAFDIYYNKEKFSLIKSLYSVIKLSFNFLVKKYL